MLENELKFEVDEAFDPGSLAELEEYELDELPHQDLTASYYDTTDLKLARSGASLRYRRGEDAGDIWTLKVPMDGGREEITFDTPPTQIPETAKELTTALRLGADLVLVATIRTKRKRWAVRETEGAPQLAELAYDEVSVVRGRRVVQKFLEIEIEAVETDGIGLAKIGNALRKTGARDSDQRSKIVRALGDAAVEPSDVPVPEDVKRSDPAKNAIRAALARNVSRLIKNDPLTRLGEPEGLHQMRVAARRTRSDLKTFGPLVDDEWARDLGRDLKWVGGVLGNVRDLDVMIEKLRDASKGMDEPLGPFFDSLRKRQDSAREEAMTALNSDRYLDLLRRLVAAAAAPSTTAAAEAPCDEALIPLVASTWRKLAGAAQSASNDAPDEILHDIRIKAKKVRYAAETVAPSLGKKTGKDLTSFAEKMAHLQDILGGHQDAIVAMSAIEDATSRNKSDPAFVFSAGRLFEREAEAARAARKELKTTWAKIDRKKNLGWLTT